MLLKSSNILARLSASSRILFRPSIRSSSTAPAIDFANKIKMSGGIFSKNDFEHYLRKLQDQQPTLEAPGDDKQLQQVDAIGTGIEEDKRVEYADLVQTQYKFGQGDAYAPHDLSFHEQRKRRARKTPSFDAMDLLGVNPIKEYKNFSMMSEYMTEMGRIKHSKDTGLRPVNQRRMAKAIRRAIGLGLMPAVHRHPEVMGMARPDKKFIPKTW